MTKNTLRPQAMNMFARLDVITDFILSAVCLVLAWKMWAAPAERTHLKQSFSAIFLAAGLAAFMGGMVHGPLHGKQMEADIWQLTLLSIGLASYHLWLVIGELVLNERMMRVLRWIARGLFLFFVVILFYVTQNFSLAMMTYLPPVVFLFVLTSLRYFREKNKFYLFGIVGFLIVLIASYTQLSKIGIPEWNLDHNTLYHILQGLGLWAVYMFGSRVSRWNM